MLRPRYAPMNYLLSMHARLLTTILIVLGVLALWAVVNAVRNASPALFRAALWVGEWLLVAECVLGGLLLLNGREPARGLLHIVYGLVAVGVLPAAFAYTRGRDARAAQVVFALACLFLSGIALRALATGR